MYVTPEKFIRKNNFMENQQGKTNRSEHSKKTDIFSLKNGRANLDFLNHKLSNKLGSNSQSYNQTTRLTFDKSKPTNYTQRESTKNLPIKPNYKNFFINKAREYTPPYEPFEIFPTWPKEEEIEVKIK